VTYDPLALIVEKTNVSRSKEKVVVSSDSKGSEADDFSELKKITALLAKVFNRRKFYSKLTNNNLRTSSTSQTANKKQYDSDQEINANMVFMAQMEKVLSNLEARSSSADEKISEVLKDQLQVKHAVIDTHVECQEKYAKLEAKRYEYMIRYSAYFDNDKQHRKQIADQEVLYDKMSVQLVELDKHQTSSLKPYVPNVILKKIIIDLEDEVVNLLEKEKTNLETIESLKSKRFESSENVISELENQSENDCRMVEKECDKVENSKKKVSSNTSNVALSAVSVSKVNKDVKRYSCKDLLSCNNSHLGETSSAYVCKDAMNVSCNPRMCDLLDDNNFFIFDDESVRISPVSKMPFRKKPCDYMNIIDSGCSKHMTGSRALLTNFVKQFLGTVRFGNNNFAVIAGYGDVVIGSMAIKKVYYRVRTDNGTEFKNKTLAKFLDEVGITQQFSAARTPQQNGVVERRNRTLVEAARTMLTFANLPSFLWAEAIATACFTQNRLIIYKRFDKTPYELINKRKPNIKFFRVFGCRCYLLNDYEDVGKLKAKGDIGVLEPGLSNLNKTRRSSNLSVSQVDEALKKDLEDLFQDFYDEYFDSSKIMKSSTTNVETSINEEVFHEIMKSSTMSVETPINEEAFHEVSESFQGESSSSSLNDDVQQSPEEVILPQSNTQFISINMVPNGDEVSTTRNVFNERSEDAYFDTTEALRDADWVSAMQEELDQFARLKVWRLVPQPEVKSVIKTKWIFKNKKDESNHVYALEKALYGLKQAPRAWYDVLSQFLIDSGFQKVLTPMVEQAKHKLDLVGKPVDHTDSRIMIGSLMYDTSSRPDIIFATCMCARYQANPNEHHVSAVKRIFHYLKRAINLGLWYPKDSGFDLTAYSDADHAGCHLNRKSTSSSVQFLGDKLVCWSSKKHNCVSISTAEFEYVAVSSCCAKCCGCVLN
nr:hypothetical protein [Tanacetum cinerariifolium]